MNNIEILERLEQMQQTFREDGLQGYEMAIVTAKKLINNLIQENKELKEHCKELIKEKQELTSIIEDDCLPKSKVKELAKKYEFALNGYDSSTADYKQSQNLGRYMACVELLEEGE